MKLRTFHRADRVLPEDSFHPSAAQREIIAPVSCVSIFFFRQVSRSTRPGETLEVIHHLLIPLRSLEFAGQMSLDVFNKHPRGVCNKSGCPFPFRRLKFPCVSISPKSKLLQ